MYVTEAFSNKPKFSAMWLTKKVYPTAPLSPGISSHYVIMNFTKETFFILTIA
jgi:hypothetical protein